MQKINSLIKATNETKTIKIICIRMVYFFLLLQIGITAAESSEFR